MAVKRKAQRNKSWTLMVYFAVDVDAKLDQSAMECLNLMKQVGSTDQVDVIAQVDRSGADTETERYYLNSDAQSSLEEDRVVTLPKRNIGVPGVLFEFIEWGIDHYPSDHYMIIVYGHGSGWDNQADCLIASLQAMRNARDNAPSEIGRVDAFSRRTSNVFTLAPEGDPADFLSNSELRDELLRAKEKLGRKIDIFGMVACLMNMAEVCYQLRESVSILAASEETVPQKGLPYHKILSQLNDNHLMPPEDLAAMVVDEYVAFYEDEDGIVTFSACDLTKSKDLADVVSRFGQVLSRGLSDSRARVLIMVARLISRSYFIKDYIDLHDFCDWLSGFCRTLNPQEQIEAACKDVIDVLDQFVLHSNSNEDRVPPPENKMARSHGVSIYFPSISFCYGSDLDFTRYTYWDEFLGAYLNSALEAEWVNESGSARLLSNAAATEKTVPRKTVKENRLTMTGNTSEIDRLTELTNEVVAALSNNAANKNAEDDRLFPRTIYLSAAEKLADALTNFLSSVRGAKLPAKPRASGGSDGDIVLEVRIRVLRD